MSLFSTREPRRFRGVHIYTSERKDKLNRLIEEAKREEQIERGETPEYKLDLDSYRGKFSKNLKRADPERRRLHPGIAIAIIVVLLILWHYLLTGSFRF
ncbi:MAG: hypothetical protein IJ700_06655 [Bacteroidaceae bacterium]|nr:hypothetical protein [Bacteroidaceae bacterium]MBR1755263.1 hypothetical protein [Bacteroidaceae bacterium]